MNSEERIINTLKREPVDRIPSFEWIIDKKVISGMYNGMISEEEFVYETDLDAFFVDPDYKKDKIRENVFRDEWGQVKQYSEEGHSFPLTGPFSEGIVNIKDYCPPDPHDPNRYNTLDKMLEKHSGKKSIIFHLNDVLSIPSRLMVYEEFMERLILDPKLIVDIINMTVDVQLEMASEIYKRGVRICSTGDDFAYISGPFMSPTMFRDIFFEPLKRVIGGFKDIGLYVIKHSDGNIMSLMDMIVESGIDCIDPIDPIAGMDIALIKKTYGDKICIKGNVDCAHTLAEGTVEKTIEESKNCIKIASPNYGYIFSSSNSIHSSVKPENYKAMLETWHEYRDYPIKL